MDNKNKLFLSDIDGTLLKTRLPICPNVVDAIKSFISSGGSFAFSTGRSLVSARKLRNTIPVNAPCVLCGGALIYDFDKDRAIRSIELKAGTYDIVENILSDYEDVSVTVTNADSVYNVRKNQRLINRGVEEDTNAPMAALRQIEKPIKILFTCDNIDTLHEIESLFTSEKGYTFKFASAHFCEVTDISASKGSAAAYIKEYMADCRLFSAGDAMSDLEMASVSEIFFAPESAMEEVRMQAEILFPPPQVGGFVQALEHVISL